MPQLRALDENSSTQGRRSTEGTYPRLTELWHAGNLSKPRLRAVVRRMVRRCFSASKGWLGRPRRHA